MHELKIRCEQRIVDRIKLLAKERGISMNKMSIYLLEIGLLKIAEQEKEGAEANYNYSIKHSKKMKGENEHEETTTYIN